MSEKAVLIVFIVLCAGQMIAVRRGRFAAIQYYFIVAPLGYFSFWKYLTWDLARVCGLLIILMDIIPRGVYEQRSCFHKHPLFLFLMYVVGATLIGSLFWPFDAMKGRSIVYGQLRGIVQIVNWCITLGVAWQIAKVLRKPAAFTRLRRTIVVMGMIHCAYAAYQIPAHYAGLPLTGMRRPASRVAADFGGEQLAKDRIAGEPLYRTTSVVGEPKSFGAVSLIWITALMTYGMEGKRNWRLLIATVVALLVLGSTFSTTAWAGGIVAIALALMLSDSRNSHFASKIAFVVLTIAVLLLVVDSSGILGVEAGALSEAIVAHSIDAWSEVISSGLSDNPEVEAQRVLAAHPHFVVFGTGCGGISLYIAQNMDREAQGVDSPNTGLLAFICDVGLVGVLLLLVALRGSVSVALRSVKPQGCFHRSIFYMGSVLMCQCFIYAGGLLPFAIGLLLATEFSIEQHVSSCAMVNQRISLRGLRRAAANPSSRGSRPARWVGEPERQHNSLSSVGDQSSTAR